VVFASGSGSNFQSILNAIHSGSLKAQVSALIASRDGIGAIEKAAKDHIPHFVIKESDFVSYTAYVDFLLNTLDSINPDCLVLAGYLKKIPDAVISKYEGRILNIHPSLLPKYGGKGFYGMHVHEAVIKNHDLESGCTVHVVTSEYDEGPVLAQSKVKVKLGESAVGLSKRVLKREHELYPRVIQDFLHSITPVK
jgi:phosphoribosylglycinamide formyltransferase-1